MTVLKPRAQANHQLVLTSLALLALDHPEHATVLHSLVVSLYGASAVPVYDALRRKFAPTPPAASAVEVLE